MNRAKYWFRLLRHFEDRRYFQNGLTVPFIIGSRTIIEPLESPHTIEEFFNDIRNSDCFISVLFCDNIREYVLSISSFEDHEIYRDYENLVIIDDSFSEANEYDDIVQSLRIRYDRVLESYMWSKTMGAWSNFSEEEIIKLREI
ncbi:hypothetical protein EYV94_18155 [Puteibacter caeruleilacunae]|nr:hypothetical protein EYV94_18155 [Puteibacter caeruleilacunae]